MKKRPYFWTQKNNPFRGVLIIAYRGTPRQGAFVNFLQLFVLLGPAQTRQGFALDLPPFEKGGPKLSLSLNYYFLLCHK